MAEKTTDPLDKLLEDGLLKAPDNFTESVLRRIAEQSVDEGPKLASRRHSIMEYLQQSLWPSTVLAASAALGGFQVIAFIFGIWIPVSTG